MAKKGYSKPRTSRSGKPKGIFVYALLLTAAFSFRVTVARLLPNDAPDDGRVYDQIARNVLDRHVYSHESEPPYAPSLIRMPGYPLFLAGIYSVSGDSDKTAVRIVQALLDTATCALIALLAFFWEPDEKRKRSSSIAALALAAFCPFTAIYAATILTETLTILFAVGMCLTATLALSATSQRKILSLWVATGLIAGIAVLIRPDSGLFALALGLTLVFATLGRASDVKLTGKREEMLYRTAQASYLGAVFTLAFCVVLVPWAIRNYRVFHFFQPLSSRYAEMPGEFVPNGYYTWLRTWIDDGRYIGPVLWSLDYAPIKLADIPDRAFDSADEKQKVGELLNKYNHPGEEPGLFVDESKSPGPAGPEDQSHQNGDNEPSPGEDSEAQKSSEQSDKGSNDQPGGEEDEEDEGDDADVSAPADQSQDQTVEMTPAIDAGFAQIARARIARHPVRYYVLLPLRRAHALWFDTHSDYYPFQGQLLPLDDLDYAHQQQYWLPLCAGLTLVYTLLGLAGGFVLWRTRDFVARQWLLLAALMIFLRLGYFATLENPEPRYTVEFFPFLAILGGIALTRLLAMAQSRRKTRLSLSG